MENKRTKIVDSKNIFNIINDYEKTKKRKVSQLTKKEDINLYEISEKITYSCQKDNLSKKTISSYVETLNLFFKWLNYNERIFRLSEITQEVFDKYVIHLINDVSPSNAKRFVKYWLTSRKKVLSEIPFFPDFDASNRKISVPKKMVLAYTDKDIQNILNSIDKNSFFGFRIYVIICIMLNCGLRVDEVLNLKLNNIMFEEKRIFVSHAKGSKERKVPLPSKTAMLISCYIKEVRGFPENDFLFNNEKNQQLTYSAIRLYYHRYIVPKVTLSNNKVWGFHQFRIKYATTFISRGGSIAKLKIILGHTNISITERYVRLVDNDFTFEETEMVDYF